MKEVQVSEASQSTLAKASATVAAGKKDANVVKSVDELSGLSAALSLFTCRFNELQQHMEFIDKSIDNFYKQQIDKESGVLGDSASDDKEASTLGGRALRRYITVNLSNVEKLREEVITALKRSPNPAKVVLDCVGRFYLQGSKAFMKDSPMIANRQASLLVLEFFLLTDCPSIEKSVKEEADQAAIAWRERLISEGGISKASHADARGLLLLLAAYGIPDDFRNRDLIELIPLCRVRDVSNALRRSPFFRNRIPDIIKGLVKEGMCDVAVDAAHSFGDEEKFPPENILISFLQEFKEPWKTARIKSQGSPVALKEADEKQLAGLRTVRKCMEDNKIDPVKLAEWKINDKISIMEKEISDLDRVIEEKGILKRKAEEVDFWKHQVLEVKHPRTSNGLSAQLHSNLNLPSQEQRQTFYDGGVSGQLNGYSGVSSLTGLTSSGTAGVGALHRTIPAHISGASLGQAAGIGGLLLGDGNVSLNNRSVGWHSDGTANDYSVRQDLMGQQTILNQGIYGSAPALEQGFSGQPSTSVGFARRNPGADLYQFADSVLDGESYNSSSRTGNFYMDPTNSHR